MLRDHLRQYFVVKCDSISTIPLPALDDGSNRAAVGAWVRGGPGVACGSCGGRHGGSAAAGAVEPVQGSGARREGADTGSGDVRRGGQDMRVQRALVPIFPQPQVGE